MYIVLITAIVLFAVQFVLTCFDLFGVGQVNTVYNYLHIG